MKIITEEDIKEADEKMRVKYMIGIIKKEIKFINKTNSELRIIK